MEINTILKSIYSSAILLLLSTSCSAHNSPDKNTVTIDVNTRKTSPLSKLIANYKGYIRLESSDDCLIEQISKTVIVNDTLYIMDKPRRTVFMFNASDGRYLNKISKAGRGPGEYTDLSDFDVYASKIYTLSYADRKLNVYSSDGRNLAQINIPDKYTKLKVIDGDRVWLYAENSNADLHNFALLNTATGNIEQRFDRFAEDGGYVRNATPFCGEYNGALYTAKYFDNRIYTLNDDAYTAAYDLDMHLQNIPQKDIATKTLAELSEMYRYREVLHKISHVFRSGNNLAVIARCFFSDYGFRDCIVKFDLKTKSTHFYRIGDEINDDFPFFNSSYIVGYANDTIISAIDAFAIKSVVDAGNISDSSLAAVKEEDNPVIFFHRLNI